MFMRLIESDKKYQHQVIIYQYISMLKTDGVEDWPMIPSSAFLYFPTGAQIRQGKDEKQWRKIFEDGNNYQNYENQQLQILEKKLKQMRIVPHAWFDKANKLRFLQANKFKIEDTCKSIKEGSVWRETSFPLKKNPQAQTKLNEGTLYFCGRDREYRPILVCQITKMKKYSKQIVPVILNTLLEYALDHLLIAGQVENYILIINLDDAGLSDKESVSKIVSFTSNTYRSRLFASYLLNTPFLIASGWNAFASAIVSQNTLRKIKISREASHEDMWKHIDKDIVQKKYGGNLANLAGPFWPPSQKFMNYVSSSSSGKDHVTKQEYNKKFKQGKLKNTKVKKQLLNKQSIATPKKIKNDQHHGFSEQQKVRQSIDQFQSPAMSKKRLLVGQNLNSAQILPREKVLQQILPPIQKRTFKLFFEQDNYFQFLKIPR